MPRYKRGSGSIYKKRGWCYIKYYVNGEPVQEATGTKDKAEARSILQARLGQLAEGRYVGPAADRVPFEEVAEPGVPKYQAVCARCGKSVYASPVALYSILEDECPGQEER